MKIIDLEAHFSTESYAKHMLSRKTPPRDEWVEGTLRGWHTTNLWAPRSPGFQKKTIDIEGQRLALMDAAGVDIQVLSLVLPGCEQFDAAEGTTVARKTNDELAEVINRHTDRFIGLAALAPQEPENAAKELERCVKALGFRGANINSHVGDEYLDEKKFWAVFEMAERLDVPVYIHPAFPSSLLIKPYEKYGVPLAGPPLGFGAEAALQAMRIIYGGVFDKFPRLKIILGHLGEGLGFWLERIDFFWLKPWSKGDPTVPQIANRPSYYIKNNFVFTTSGMSFMPALMATYMALGAEMITFGADYPFEDSKQSVDAVNLMPVCDIDKEKIFHLNAEKLFKLN